MRSGTHLPALSVKPATGDLRRFPSYPGFSPVERTVVIVGVLLDRLPQERA
jgi:hypothetical protein